MQFLKLLRGDLAVARKANDTEMVSLIRTLIAAIENAEAVDPSDAEGVTEVPRRHLSDVDILNIILDEGNELRHAADECERRGHGEAAQRLHSLAEVADHYARTFDKKPA
jgi:uncharacterized protein